MDAKTEFSEQQSESIVQHLHLRDRVGKVLAIDNSILYHLTALCNEIPTSIIWRVAFRLEEKLLALLFLSQDLCV